MPVCREDSVTLSLALTVNVKNTDGAPQVGVKVYAFNGTTYTNFSSTTDADGKASFTLPHGSYRFRADFNGTEFWSGASNHCDIPGCTSADVTVTNGVLVTVQDTDGTAKPGIKVYAFNGTTYTNYSATTNASGQVTFTLPQGNYRFRADLNGTLFWSDTQNHCSVPTCGTATVTVTKPLTVTVKDTDGAVKPGIKVYAFNGATYTNFSGTTDASGQVTFTLPQGNYRFRADLNGTLFWSGASNHCTLPDCTSAEVILTIPLVVSVQIADGTPQSGVKVYAFNGATYTNYSGTTNASGQATFTLPQGSYRFRVDYNNLQYWSGGVNHCALAGCTTLTVIVGPQPTATTTSAPTATATATSTPEPSATPLPTSTPTVAPSETLTPEPSTPEVPTPTEQISLQSGSVAMVSYKSPNRIQNAPAQQSTGVVVTVQDTDGVAQSGIKVYVFDGTTYKNISAITDANGQATLNLPDGAYRFRADLNGTQFWSSDTNVCVVPTCTSASVTVTKPITMTVQDTDGTAKADIKVYAFDGTAYTNYSGTTDASGQVTLTLPQGNYRFRADLNGTQFWSADTNNCEIPTCTSPSVTVTLPVTVTVQSQTNDPYPNLQVYAFDGTVYTGFHGTTDTSGKVTFTLPQGNYHFRADYDGVQFWSTQENDCTLPGCVSATVTLPGGTGEVTTTIDYTYDPLYRLTNADYSTGDSYQYAYDSVGNRLTQESMVHGLSSTVNYNYDIANRLADVNGVAYSYDSNGNLRNDGVNEYTYDPANRLTSVNGPSSSVQYTYNGLGDRLSQTVDGISTNYTLDLNTGLTQVLSDGTTSYTYGLGRISQQNGSIAEYFLGDALGSVRQMANQSGAISFTQTYDPYGVVTQISGTSQTDYGFTGEQQDGDLVYLRARYLNVSDGRFQSKDMWEGDVNRPMSYNSWLYVYANPIILTDPSGHDPWWCDNQNNPELCYAQWSIDHGGKLTAETIESLWQNDSDYAFRLLQQQFKIKIPPGYSFRLASSASSAFDGFIDVYGFGAWYSSSLKYPGEILELSGILCQLLSFDNADDAAYIDYGIYITTFAFEKLKFYPDDIAGVMIHEATHAWQEHVTLYNLSTQTDNWHALHSNGMERQADDAVIEADNIGRIDTTRSFLNTIKRHRKNVKIGKDFPYPLPSGVP